MVLTCDRHTLQVCDTVTRNSCTHGGQRPYSALSGSVKRSGHCSSFGDSSCGVEADKD